MIHENALKNTILLVDGAGNNQFCVLFSCLHVLSSCTDDFLQTAVPHGVVFRKRRLLW